MHRVNTERFNSALRALALGLSVGLALSACGSGGGSDLSSPSSAPAAPSTPTYTIGGTVTTSSGSLALKLQDNGTDSLTVSSSGTFTFAKALTAGASYNVTVASTSPGQSCTVSNGTGTVADANVTNIAVACVPGTFSLLHTFAGTADGQYPYGGLIQGSDGNFYGMTQQGGANGDGTVFRMTPAGTFALLHTFAGTADGGYPVGTLIQGVDGNFYGMTQLGGANGDGTVFRMTPAGVVTLLHSFAGTPDGQSPYGSLIQGSDGNFYGMTESGGASGAGTVFQMTPAGTFALLHSFAGGTADGQSPNGSLIQGVDGNFYGMTQQGGASGAGTVFRMTPAGTFALLHSFALGTANGQSPNGSLTQGVDGNFYGMTESGGASGAGTVFQMTPAGAVTLLHSFAGGAADGQSGLGSLIQGSDGNFYGMTQLGGANGDGTVFQMTPAGAVTLLHSFAGGTADGQSPYIGDNLIQGSDGNLYGMTLRGGASGVGTVFVIN